MSGKVWVTPHHGPGTITDHMPPCVHPGRRSWADGGEGGGRLALRGGSRRQAGPGGQRVARCQPGCTQRRGRCPGPEGARRAFEHLPGPAPPCGSQEGRYPRSPQTPAPPRPAIWPARTPARPGPARRHPSARAHAHSWAPRLVLGRRSRILHLPRPAHQPRQRRRRVAIPAAYLPSRSAPGPAASPPRPQSTRGRPWRRLTLAPLPSTSRKMTLRRRRRRKARSRGLRC